MAIKFRCKSCQHGIKVPDDAAGKAIKCPECGTKMRIPGGKPSSASGGTRKRKRKVADDPGSDAFLDNLNLDRIEMDVQLCQKCATEIPEGETQCPNCGFDPEQLTVAGRKRSKMSAQGIDPATFYETVWKDSFGFALAHFGKVFKTGFLLSFFFLLAGLCAYMMVWVATVPPFGFYALVTTVCFMIPWGLLLNQHLFIMQLTLQRKDKIKKMPFDFALSGMNGIKFFAWLLIFGLPFWVVFGGLGFLLQSSGMSFGLAVGVGLSLLSIAVFTPQAMSHLAMPVEYPGWMVWKIFPSLGISLLPGLMWMLLFVVVNLPALGILGAVAAVGGNDVQEFVRVRMIEGQVREAVVMLDMAEGASSEAKKEELIERYTEDAKIEPPPKQWSWLTLPIVGVVASCFWVGFSSFVVARANGLFTANLKKGLHLISQEKEVKWEGSKAGEPKIRTRKTTIPAPAGKRFLAYFIDNALIGGINGLIGFILGAVAGVIASFANVDTTSLLYLGILTGISVLVSLIVMVSYYVNQESGEEQTTFGKKLFNLYVCTDDYQPISTLQAVGRFFGFYFVSTIATLTIGSLLPLFRQDRKTLHDMMSGTQVRMDKPAKQTKSSD